MNLHNAAKETGCDKMRASQKNQLLQLRNKTNNSYSNENKTLSLIKPFIGEENNDFVEDTGTKIIIFMFDLLLVK